jgi:hypothetical protein
MMAYLGGDILTIADIDTS